VDRHREESASIYTYFTLYRLGFHNTQTESFHALMHFRLPWINPRIPSVLFPATFKNTTVVPNIDTAFHHNLRAVVVEMARFHAQGFELG
jgi:hypothetical protein